MIIVNMDNLETIKTQLPIADKVRIYRVDYFKATPQVVAKVTGAIKRLEAAALAGKADPYLFLRLEPKALELWQWAVGEYGQDAVMAAWQQEKREAA